MKKSIIAMLLILPVPLQAGEDQYIESGEDGLTQGRALWMQNCEGCHAYGVADAPIPMQPEEWRARIEKGMPVLYEHAINGFIGPDYSMMPARGGNEELTDPEARLAVDYMVFLAEYYISKQDSN